MHSDSERKRCGISSGTERVGGSAEPVAPPASDSEPRTRGDDIGCIYCGRRVTVLCLDGAHGIAPVNSRGEPDAGLARAPQGDPPFVGVDQGPDGCWFACIASLTGIPLSEFPPPPVGESGASEVRNAVTKLLHAHGWQMHRLWEYPGAVPRGWALAGGTSPRRAFHSIIVYDGVMVWDPHPSRAGLMGEIEEYEILVPVRAGNALPARGVPAPQGDAAPRDLLTREATRVVLLRLWEDGYGRGQHAPATWSERDQAVDDALAKVLRGGASSSGSSPLRERPLSPADLPLTFGMPKEPGDDMGGQST